MNSSLAGLGLALTRREPGPKRWQERWSERGAGTVLMMTVVGALGFALLAALAVGHVAVHASRASTAADLAALAAADTARGLTSGDPCAVAADVAGRNGAKLASCRRVGDSGTSVDVSTEIPLAPGWVGAELVNAAGLHATGVARAGPPPSPWNGTAITPVG